MICLIQNVEDYNNDLRVILMAFYMGVKIITPENIERSLNLGQMLLQPLWQNLQKVRQRSG